MKRSKTGVQGKKGPYAIFKQHSLRSACAYMVCSETSQAVRIVPVRLYYTTESTDSVNAAQADLGFRCSHMV